MRCRWLTEWTGRIADPRCLPLPDRERTTGMRLASDAPAHQERGHIRDQAARRETPDVTMCRRASVMPEQGGLPMPRLHRGPPSFAPY